MSGKETKTFTREATGLVKDISLFSMFAYNVNSLTVALDVTLYLLILALIPGADATLAFVIGILTAIPFLLIIVFFTAAMPRSGGDYVFSSRVLNPFFGVVGSFSIWIVEILWLGIAAGWISSVYISGALTLLGQLVNSPGLISIGAAATDPSWVFVVGTLALLGIGATMVVGVRVHFTFQNILFIVGSLAAVAMIVLLAVSTHQQFVSSFNSHAAPYTNTSTPYDTIVPLAISQGFSVAPFSWYATLVALTSAWPAAAFAYFGTYSSGEMKRANDIKRQSIAMIGSMLFNVLLSLIIAVLVVRVAGSDFVGAAYYLGSFAPASWPYPVAPFLNVFIGMLTTNPVLSGFFALGWIAWGVAAVAILFMMLTRLPLAWSLDRVVPSSLADVSGRFHTPLKATLVVILVGEVFLYVFSQVAPATASIVSLAVTAVFVFTAFLFVSVAGIVFPYSSRSKQIFTTSPVSRYRVAGVPLISVLGAISTAVMVLLGYFFLTDAALGVNSPDALILIAAIIGGSAILYVVIRAVRKTQSIDIGYSFREIPPE
jgi:basic amino acid/polyamine antiporter, APA family